MKNIICIFSLTLFMASYHSTGSSAGTMSKQDIYGFKEASIDKTADLSDYDVIFIDRVDTGNIEVETAGFDDEDSQSEMDIRWETGEDMRNRFFNALGKVIDVERDPGRTQNREALILKLAISGYSRESGLLQNLLPGVEERNSALSMTGSLSEYPSGKEVITFSDTYIAPSKGNGKGHLLTGIDDMDQWHRAMGLWAENFAAFIRAKKENKI